MEIIVGFNNHIVFNHRTNNAPYLIYSEYIDEKKY